MATNVRREQAPPFNKKIYGPAAPGKVSRVVERMKGEQFEVFGDRVERLEELGYEIVSDPTKRLVRMECDEKDFLARRKAASDRHAAMEKSQTSKEKTGDGGSSEETEYSYETQTASPPANE